MDFNINNFKVSVLIPNMVKSTYVSYRNKSSLDFSRNLRVLKYHQMKKFRDYCFRWLFYTTLEQWEHT